MSRLPRWLKLVFPRSGCAVETGCCQSASTNAGATIISPLKQYADKKQNYFRALLALVGFLCFLIAPLSPQQPGSAASVGPAPQHMAIEPPRPNYPFPDARSYVYSAEWHLITAGTGVVRMNVTGNERKVTATAESAGAVNVIFPVHDRFE